MLALTSIREQTPIEFDVENLLDDLWGDGLARSAPSCEAVYN